MVLAWILWVSTSAQQGPVLGIEPREEWTPPVARRMMVPTHDACLSERANRQDALQSWWRWLHAEILDAGTEYPGGVLRMAARSVQLWGHGIGIIHFHCTPAEVS